MGSFFPSTASVSASLPCSSSSSSSFPIWKYDVFISFRGEDTRKTFTSHLRAALSREKIQTYIDEENLVRGDEISAALLRAIEESMISVVIFSENYANSSWCLDELVHILKCKREYGRQVVPVFYKVDPSHVRNQRGSYTTAFAKRKKCFEHKLDSWRAALTEAANLAGWGSQDTRTEFKLVEVIVEDIFKKINGLSPSYDHEYLKGLFGIEKDIKQIESLLDIGTQEVRKLGISGMDGTEKITLARVLSNKCSPLFEGCCFLENEREESEKANCFRKLKLKLFSELLNRKDLDPYSTFERNSRKGNSDLSSSVLVEEVGKICMSKWKKESEEGNAESRTPKFRKTSMPGEQAQLQSSLNQEEEKKKVRLMRNRKSSQLSRKRKKHYVEELEDKVRNMHSTITNLNCKISYIMAENATLRQLLSSGSMCPPPPPPGMYPHPPMAPMGYPWMPCAPYVVKPQGSQVPFVPIPRLKLAPTVSASKAKKEGKKTEGKTKKVASISLLGLLVFVLLFGGLVPIVNVNFGSARDNVSGGSAHLSDRFYDQHQGRVLTVNGHDNGSRENVGEGVSGSRLDGFEARHHERGHVKEISSSDEFVHHVNTSELLLASLYVPRNDTLVEIDGNLTIHSVLASEKTKASLVLSTMKNSERHSPLYRQATERQKAISSGAIDAMKENSESQFVRILSTN